MARHDDAGHARASALRNIAPSCAIGHAVTDQQEGWRCSRSSSRLTVSSRAAIAMTPDVLGARFTIEPGHRDDLDWHSLR